MSLLKFFPVEQKLPRPRVEDVGGELAAILDRDPPALAPNSTVAVCVGSRNITALPTLIAALTGWLKKNGHRPFIVAAMGSHGGKDRAGRREVLASLGITEEAVGAPLKLEEETLVAGHTASGVPVWVQKAAWEADYIVPLNRVKPHTAFRGVVESGPAKMLAVGLGHLESAVEVHRAGLAETIPAVLKFHLASGKVPFGVAVVENPWKETAAVELLTPESWLEKESGLLRSAWELYPLIPFPELDILIIEKIGKDISGTCMDLNVIGMGRRFPHELSGTKVGKVIALTLTPQSDGNGTGVGYADLITEELASRMDWGKTRLNCETSGFFQGAIQPETALDEEDAVRRAIRALYGGETKLPPPGCRAARITSTADLVQLSVTKALLDKLPPTVSRLRGKAVDRPVDNSKTPTS